VTFVISSCKLVALRVRVVESSRWAGFLLPGEYWDCYDHSLALTELSLGEVLTETGFTLEEQIPWFLPYTMSPGGQSPVWMLRLYLKLKFAWPLFGK